MEAPAGVLVEGIARGYRRKGVYTVRSVLSRIGQTWRMYDGDIISMCSLRYQVFSRSLVCVSCGITGSYFAKEQSHHNNINPRSWHSNLYASNDQGHEILMTKDHVIPKSKGGLDTLDNLQTMCYKCNTRKGDGTTNPRALHGVPQEGRRNDLPPEKSREDIRLFKREFVRVFLEHLG